MKRILSLFVVLLFVTGCGGGSEGSAPVDLNEIPSFDGVPGVTVATDDPCSSPLLTRVAPLPRGSNPLWLVNGINALPPAADGAFLRLRSDGTMYGNMGRSFDISVFIEVHDACGVGTRAPAYAGHWIYTQDKCYCQRLDVLPSAVLCIYALDTDSQTACSHHETRPTASGQANASLQSSEESVPDWYDPDIEGLIEEIPQVSEGISEILTELE